MFFIKYIPQHRSNSPASPAMLLGCCCTAWAAAVLLELRRGRGSQQSKQFAYTLTILTLNVCFQTLDPLNSPSSDNFDEKIVNNCISNLYIPTKLVTSVLQLSQTTFISSLVQENIFAVLTSSRISLRSLGVKCSTYAKYFLPKIH